MHGAPFCGFVLVRGGPLFWCRWIGVRFGRWCFGLGPILVHGAPFCGFVLVRGGPLFWCLVWALVRYGAAFCGSLSALFWSPFCVEAPI